MVLECKHVWGHISGYLDGTLPADVLEQVQQHLEHCEICSAILDSTRNILILTADEQVKQLSNLASSWEEKPSVYQVIDARSLRRVARHS
jgi:anti-sigma factor RsiW